MSKDGNSDFVLREAVAVFPTELAFLRAVDDLQEHGFDRADISVLADVRHTDTGVAKVFEGATALADDGRVPRTALVNPESVAEAKAATVALPIYIGTIGSFLAAVASGGSLAFTIPIALAGGLAGGGLGAIGASGIGKRHRQMIERQVLNGGILLWVRTDSPEKEQHAKNLLKAAGGKNVHLHEMTIQWGEDDVPLAHLNPDPLLKKGPEYD